MAAVSGHGAAEEPTNGSGSLRGEPASSLGSLPLDLQRSILSCVSGMSRGYSHALVCKDWAALAPSAQLSCACTCREAETTEGCTHASQVSQELSLFPSLTSLDITATRLPECFLSFVPSSLKHLWVQGENKPLWIPLGEYMMPSEPEVCGEDTAFQGLARLQSLHTLSVLNYKIPEDEWPLTASLRILDVGGVGKMAPLEYPAFGERAAGGRRCRGSANLVPEALLEQMAQLRELRVFRATLSESVLALPDSMSGLTNLEELNLWGLRLISLFSGLGNCRELRRLLYHTEANLDLPPSLTRLRCLSFLYASSISGVRAPPGIEAVTSLRTIEIDARRYTSVSEADALFSMPSLQRLQTTGLPTDMSMLTSLQELILSSDIYWEPEENYPESMWALGNLRVLTLEDRRLGAIPESICGLARLEELKIAGCHNIEGLPDSLAVLPHLKKVVLQDLTSLRSLPHSIGSWPSLQSLHLRYLYYLRVPQAVLRELSRLKDLQIERCARIVFQGEMSRIMDNVPYPGH